MTSPQENQAWVCFQEIASKSDFAGLIVQHQLGMRQRVYGLATVMGLMIWQRLHGGASLAAAVLALPERRRSGKAISLATGAYCPARQRVPTLVVQQVSDDVFERLRKQAPAPPRPVFIVDGTTLRLEQAPELVEAFPPGHNQHRKNHWPVLRLVAFHDAHAGLAARPTWGPMYGAAAVSEQHLAEQGLTRLPADAVVLGDANFGIFAFAYAVQHSQRPAVLRLTKSRASKILGPAPDKAGRRKVLWTPSRQERKAHPDLPAAAQVEGWVAVCKHPLRRSLGSTDKLYLFTTLDQSAKQTLALYKLRWNIETDLRSWKRTVDLHHIHSRSVEVMENELLLAVTAYNLVRTVMLQAARRSDRPAREFSFAHVQAAVQLALPGLEQACTHRQRQQLMRELVEVAVPLTLPKRKRKRPSYPRQVWGRGGTFPPHPRPQQVQP